VQPEGLGKFKIKNRSWRDKCVQQMVMQLEQITLTLQSSALLDEPPDV
jgi:hypothetical protein